MKKTVFAILILAVGVPIFSEEPVSPGTGSVPTPVSEITPTQALPSNPVSNPSPDPVKTDTVPVATEPAPKPDPAPSIETVKLQTPPPVPTAIPTAPPAPLRLEPAPTTAKLTGTPDSETAIAAFGMMIASLAMLAPVHQRHITMPTDFGTSARTVAIGSILGLDTLASSLFENPAALPKDPGTHYSTFFTTFSDGNSALLAMAAAYPLDKGTVAIGFVQKRNPYLDAGFLENNTHFSSAANYALTESLYKLGYELPLTSHTSIGASIHYYTQDLYVTQGHGLNADLGIRIENGPFLVSVVGSNLLNSSSVAYTGGYPNVDFPSDTIISSRYAASDKLALFGQFKGVQGLKAFGFRYAFLPTMELQAGWREIQSLGLHSQWSMGTSIVMSPKIKIHLSWQPREATITDSYVGFSIDIQP